MRNSSKYYEEAMQCSCKEGTFSRAGKAKTVPKRDMATSPNLGSKSPKIIVPGINAHHAHQAANTILPPPPKSPTIRSRTTRSAATSPRVDLRQRPALSPIRIDHSTAFLDGSLSPRPSRELRSAHSLSPRPPMRHQTAITVCDENEVVSVKLSPNEVATGYFDRSTKRCQSEHASPNVFEDRNFLYDEKVINTNRSTGCLVYVPSDPWLRMSDEDVVTIQSSARNKKKKRKKNRSGAISADARTSSSSATKFVFPAVAKSRSKPNILDYDDPWVWQGDVAAGQQSSRGTGPRGEVSKRREQKGLSRQTKSLQSKLPTEKEWYSQHWDANSTGDMREKGRSNQAMDGAKVSSSGNVSKSLQVTMNLQPRHSFSSTPSQRDEELQLNIRRLSEQTRHTTTKSPMGSTGAVMSRGNWLETSGGAGVSVEYDATGTWIGRETMTRGRKSTRQSQDNLKSAEDPLLETTC